MGAPGEPRPYTIHVPDGVLQDLRGRLARTRWPDEPPGVTGSINASFRPYCDRMHQGWPLLEGRIDVPTGYAEFPREILHPPRPWAERAFDLCWWTPMARDGHFAALETPDLLAEDIRAFLRPLRRR